MHLNLTIAGLATEIDLSSDILASVYQPILKEMGIDQEHRGRQIFFLAGPPGTGKSTFAAIVQSVAKIQYEKNLFVLPMDGFHFPNEYLRQNFILRDGENIPLKNIKGAPESYDLASMTKSLEKLKNNQDLRWPIYDRIIHDVVPDALDIPADGIFIVEGNYLLLDEPGWRELSQFAQKRFFITISETVLRERLISRHLRGGKTLDHAQRWVDQSDLSNARRVLAHQLPADRIISGDLY